MTGRSSRRSSWFVFACAPAAALWLVCAGGALPASASDKAALPDHQAVPLGVKDGVWAWNLAEVASLAPPPSGFFRVAGGAEPKKRASPSFPSETMKLGNYRCTSWIYTEEDGTPAEVDVTECDEAHRGPIREAAMKWRFDAPEVEGKPVHSFFRLDVLVKVDDNATAERPLPATTQGQAVIPATLVPAGQCAWSVPAPVPDLGIAPVRKEPGGAVFALDCASPAPSGASRVVPAELKLRSYVEPVSPDAGAAAATCGVRVYMDGHGVPLNIGVVDCPSERQGAVVKAMKEWRFVPVLVEGKPAPVNFLFSLSLPEAPPKPAASKP
jgi:hypothetical protein